MDAVTCAGKIAHASRRLAAEALHVQCRRLDTIGRDRPALNVYRCEHCGGYHVGSVDVPRRRAARLARRVRCEDAA